MLSVAELRACGLSADAILTRVRRGNLHPLHRGVYAVGHRNVTTEGRFLAAVKACGEHAVLSHYCAACHHGWLGYRGRPVDVTAPTKRTRPTIKTHRSEVIERIVVRQIPVTPRIRTIIDLARVEPEDVVKRALRQARFTEAELELLPRCGLLGRIVDLSTAPTASGNEDVVLDLVLKARLRAPARQCPVPRLSLLPRSVVARATAHRGGRRLKWHSDPIAQRDDLDRQAWLEARGERVLRTAKPQVRRNPARFVARLIAAGAPMSR